MGVYQVGPLQSYQQSALLTWLSTTFTISANLSSEGRLDTLTRDLTAPEQAQLTAQVTTITSAPDPAIARAAEKTARKATVKGNFSGQTIASLNASQTNNLIQQYVLYKMAEDGWIQNGVINIPNGT